MNDKLLFLQRPGVTVPAPSTAVGEGSQSEPIELPEITDFYAWANQQAEYLRTGRFELLDLQNVIDEIESLGRSEIHSLRSNLAVTLTHMLKWDYQQSKRSRSWINSIGEHRDRIEVNLSDSPSLSNKKADIVAAAYKLARRRASRETRLPLDTFPEACPYTWTQITEAPYDFAKV